MLKIELKKTSASALTSALTVVPLATNPTPTENSSAKRKKTAGAEEKFKGSSLASSCRGEFAALDKSLNGQLTSEVQRTNFTVAAGNRLAVPAVIKGIVHHLRLSGVDAKALSDASELDAWRRVGGDAITAAKAISATNLEVSLHSVKAELLPTVIGAVAEGLTLGAYEFTNFKSGKKKAVTPIKITLGLASAPTKANQTALRIGSAVGDAVSSARDLVNAPPSNLPPKEVVKFARQLKLSGKGTLKVFNRAQLKKMGAGAILGVAAGSEEEPFLIHLHIKPKKRSKASKTITLIGKGVTFDSGGLSIKPGKSMEDMKCDMAGAAAVLCTAQALLSLRNELDLIHDIHVIVPTTENVINGQAFKPGDVLKTISGKTIEVLNTDAEGRLILADALDYAAKNIKSDTIVDLATLTGACIVAIGDHFSGLFSDSEDQINRFTSASKRAGEKLWRLPIATEYRPQMNSEVADIKNIGNGGPGATMGALFLKDFVPEGVDWVHLDIAGPAFITRTDDYLKKGATGVGVRLLLEYLSEI